MFLMWGGIRGRSKSLKQPVDLTLVYLLFFICRQGHLSSPLKRGWSQMAFYTCSLSGGMVT